MCRLAAAGLTLAVVMAIGLSGCSSDPPPPQGNGGLPYEGQTVRVVVVDDPGMAEAVRELQTAWKARSGAGLAVTEETAVELAKAEKIDADAVIYPSAWLGELAERKLIEPAPEALFEKANKQLNWDDVFPAIARREATWGTQTVALPLGSRVLVCYYRADLLKKHDQQPPKTWEEYDKLVRFFAKHGDEVEFPAVEPLGEGWAGITLLARAAAYGKHRDFFSMAFDLQTMEPRIEHPPYVRALEELIKANAAAKDVALRTAPTDAVDRFVSGECALAIGWPRGRGQDDTPMKVDSSAVGCMPLPGAAETYNWDRRRYERVKARGVTLLSCAGRFGSVTSTAKSPPAAWQLLANLADTDWGTRVSTASDATAPFRASQVPAAKRWLAKSHADAAGQYGRAVAASLKETEVVYALRIPGRQQYLTALDDTVRQAVAGKLDARTALKQATDRWREITKQLGKDAQTRACENSVVRLGL